MIYQIIISIFYLYFWWFWGKRALQILQISISKDVYFVVGITMVIPLHLIAAYFFTLGAYFEYILYGVSLVLSLILKDYLAFYAYLKEKTGHLFTLSLFERSIYFGSILLLLAIGSNRPYMLDHYGYIQPTLQWLNEYGLVRGIANLDITLGQQNTWHILQAGSDTFDVFHKINTALVLAFFLYFVKTEKIYVWIIFTGIFALNIASPSSDMPLYIFSIILLIEFLKEKTNFYFCILLWILIFIIKPLHLWSIPLLIVIGFRQVTTTWNWRVIGFASLLLALHIVKNIHTSALPLFPMNYFAIDTIYSLQPLILKYSEMGGLMMGWDFEIAYQELANMTFSEKIIAWLSLDGIQKYIHIAILAYISIFVLNFLIHYKHSHPRVKWILLGICIQLVYLFSVSPQYRFMLSICLLITLLLSHFYFYKLPMQLANVAILICMIAFCSKPQLINTYFLSYSQEAYFEGFASDQLIFPKPIHTSDVQYKKIGNLIFYYDNSKVFVGDSPLPSVRKYTIETYLHQLKKIPQWASENPKDGFIFTTISEDEIPKDFFTFD